MKILFEKISLLWKIFSFQILQKKKKKKINWKGTEWRIRFPNFLPMCKRHDLAEFSLTVSSSSGNLSHPYTRLTGFYFHPMQKTSVFLILAMKMLKFKFSFFFCFYFNQWFLLSVNGVTLKNEIWKFTSLLFYTMRKSSIISYCVKFKFYRIISENY